jgi:hypothetical protein
MAYEVRIGCIERVRERCRVDVNVVPLMPAITAILDDVGYAVVGSQF